MDFLLFFKYPSLVIVLSVLLLVIVLSVLLLVIVLSVLLLVIEFSVRPSFQNIFRHIFLSNYWWQKSDIWSPASHRYAISWEAFLEPPDSYSTFTFDPQKVSSLLLFNTYLVIWKYNCEPLWFLPSIVVEKNVHICSMWIQTN
jgi:hypothetical protein